MNLNDLTDRGTNSPPAAAIGRSAMPQHHSLIALAAEATPQQQDDQHGTSDTGA
jgi:hypothetical protein